MASPLRFPKPAQIAASTASGSGHSRIKDWIMRYYPAAIALSLALAMTASVGQGQEREADPRAASLQAEGRAALQAGEPQQAVDLFEAALAVDPGMTGLYLDLANAARAQDLPGKAIHYYRVALVREPSNFDALSGEGQALAARGALDKARQNLAKLESLCGSNCSETRELAMAVNQAVQSPSLAAEAVSPDDRPQSN
jgi:tetratricopeptide (TPR) repeat protein